MLSFVRLFSLLLVLVVANLTICQAKWVQIRLDLPSPGEPDHDTVYRPLKQDHVKILDELGNELPEASEEGFTQLDEVEVEIDLDQQGQEQQQQQQQEQQQGQGQGQQGQGQQGQGQQGQQGQGQGQQGQGQGQQGQGQQGQGQKEQGQQGQGQHGDKYKGLPLPGKEAMQRKKPVQYHPTIKPLHKVTKKPISEKPMIARDYYGRSSGEVVTCRPDSKAYPDPVNPVYYYLCVEMGNEYHEIKMKCPIGIFHESELLCRWDRPLPPEPTAEDCKSEEQMLPSPSDPKCYYYCIKDEGKVNAEFELVVECVDDKDNAGNGNEIKATKGKK